MEEADIILLRGNIQPVNGGILSVSICDNISIANIKEVAQIADAVHSKKRIIWFDTRGPDLVKNKDLFSDFRDTDIFISPASIPPHPNLFTNAWHVEKSVFFNIKGLNE